MFERFTERARQVVVLAQEEARILKHNYIGTEHILLGLLREQEGLAARVLESLDITVERVRAQVVRIVGSGEEVTSGPIPFTPRAKKVLELALREALSLGHNYIGTEHILLGLLREEEGLAARVLESLDITVERVRAQVVRIVGSGEEVTSGQIPFTPRAKKVLELALREALSLGHNYIGTEHILLGLVRENEGVAARILLDFDADSEKIRNEVIRMLSGPGGRRSGSGQGSGSGAGAAAGPGEGKKSSKLLDQFGRNLTKLAAEGKLDPVIGRETEIERIMQILSRRTKNNPVLIGEPGVGKTAVVEGLAQRITNADVL